MSLDIKPVPGFSLLASGESTPAAPIVEATSHEDVALCWICLDGSGSLVQPCACPRHVHANCLARWQLQSAGSRREVACEFCDRQLPDWKKTLTPVCGVTAPAVMNVNFNGRTYGFEVRPGPQGYHQFTSAIRRAFGLPGDSELNITFTCDEPTAIDSVADIEPRSEPVTPLPALPGSPSRSGSVATHAPPLSPLTQQSNGQQQSCLPEVEQLPQPESPVQWPIERPDLSFESPVPSLTAPLHPPPLPPVLPLSLADPSSRQAIDWEASRESPSPPLAAMLLTLQGAGAYDAAVHCASVSAARRMLQERLVAASVPSISDGSSSIRGNSVGQGVRPYGPFGGGLYTTHSAASAINLRRKKRISAAVSRKLRALCDMLSFGR